MRRKRRNHSASFKAKVAVTAVDGLPPVKRFFMRHAMGLVGDLPRLMRGGPL